MTELFCERLRRLRKERGMSQRALVAKIGISQSELSRWERGKNPPGLLSWEQVAAVLEVDVPYLLTGNARPVASERPSIPISDEMLHDRMRRLRIDAGLTQRMVQARLGVNHSAVGDWEAGRTEPSAQNAAALARLYGVTIDYLWNGREAPNYAALIAAVKRSGTRDPVVLALVERY